MSEIVLSLRNVSRVYQQGGRSLTVLEQLDLDVFRGEMVALVGPSGSGKTTLLQLAGLLDTPTSGAVQINGEMMSGSSDKKRTLMRRKHIGFVYQFHHLQPEFSALENVMLPQLVAGERKRAAREKAELLLATLGLIDRLTHRPARLSGGEQQRVAIARAVANSPALLLADEPTGNLDPATAEIVFAMMLKLARENNVAALVATHNLELARRMDRIVHIDKGMLKAGA